MGIPILGIFRMPTRSRTALAGFDNGFAVKQRHQPHVTSFVSAFDSTGYEQDSQSSGGDI